jgi:uncharacterized protein YeaO (DUF488 family)
MIGTYRYGEPRADSSLRIGVARQPPRGVRHQDYQKKNYFDLWLRVLSPSPELVSRYRKKLIIFSEFEAGYRAEMGRMEPRQVIGLVALLSRSRPISIGCFCEREDSCHRSILKRLIESADSEFPPGQSAERRPNASPVCYLEEEEN